MSERDQCGLCLRPKDALVHQPACRPGAPTHTFVPFCDHKFVDSRNCLKCGISVEELEPFR